MLTFLFWVAIYLLIALVTTLSFLAQAPWVLTKESYAQFDHEMRIRIMITGTALGMYVLVACLLGICWPYTYWCRFWDKFGGGSW